MATAKNLSLKIKKIVLEFFMEYYSIDDSREIKLTLDLNDLEIDPGPFYERLVDVFGVPFDDASDNFGGYGGTLNDTIAYIQKNWDGTTLRTPATAAKTLIDCPALSRADRLENASFHLEDQIASRFMGTFSWAKNEQAGQIYLPKAQLRNLSEIDLIVSELKNQVVVTDHVLDFLLENTHEIPLGWRIYRIYFWGSIYRNQEGSKFVRCLECKEDRWGTQTTILADGNFDKNCLALTTFDDGASKAIIYL